MKKIFQRLAVLSLAAVTALAGAALPSVPAYGADHDTLHSAISQAEQIDVSGYTEESTAFLQKVLNSSAQVIKDESADNSRINHHVTLLNAAVQALVKKEDKNSPVCGNYTIKGILRQASSDSASMGNASIIQPMELIVDNDETILRLQFTSLTVPGLGQGFLSDLSYLPDWEGMLQQMTEEQRRAFQACTVEEYHEGVYDLFNDPDTGIDAAIRGKLYPKYLTMPVTYGDPEVWVRVYVPIMESISAGGGTQYARLQMDWDTLTWMEPDKSVLKEAQEQLIQLKETVVAADYTQEMAELLKQAIVTGEDVLNSTKLGQSQVDAMAQALNAVANLFADTDKQYLYDMIQMAESYTSSDYTDVYVEDMKKRIRAAQEVYNNAFATQTQVNEQYALLLQAISNAQKKESFIALTPTPAETKTPDSTPTPAETQTPEKTNTAVEGSTQNLDKNNLKDGIYAVTGKMVKVDKSTASMSNDAINHTIKLVVENGTYQITLDFMGLNISGRYGYLSELKYFQQGYTLDGYGVPQGTVEAVTVDSYQLDSSGARVSDTYGTDYPNQVTFPLISEAVKDGYVPLQVYVPIMEAISAGTGTQPVFLFLDWNTLKSTTEDDDGFRDQESSSQGSATGTTTGTGNGLTASPSQHNSSASLTGGNNVSRSSTSASLNATTISAKAARSESVSSETTFPETISPDAGLSNAEFSDEVTEEKADTQAQDTNAGDSPSLPDPAAVPTVMSILMVASGFLFKLKSRGGL